MGTASERRAVRWLLLLGAAGILVRALGHDPGPPGAVLYRGPRPPPGAVDSLAARAQRLRRPLGRGERIDLDRATAEEIGRLPRIGAGLAARIVADREARGPFGSLEELDRVPGVGPTMLDAIRPHAAFSRKARPAAVADRRVSLNTASAIELTELPGIGPARAAAIVADRARRGPYRTVDDLTRVSGLGPATVNRLRDRVRVP